MSDAIELRRYTKSDRDEVFAFFREVHSSQHSDRLIRQWDWKYEANPYNLGGDPYILLLTDNDKLIGIVGAVFFCVSVNGRLHQAVQGCDLVIHPRYRGRRLTERFVRQFEGDHPMTWAWMNERSVRVAAPVSRGRLVRLTPLVRPLDLGQALRQMTGSQALGRWGSVLATGGHRLVHFLKRRPGVPGVTITEIASHDERADSLWQRVCQQFPVIVVRDQRYLNWRFGARPDVKYTMLTATRGPDLVGYLVFRLGEKARVPCGFLVDFLVEDKSSSLLALLVEEAVSRLWQARVGAILCLATALSYRRTILRQGFYSLPWRQPSYFGTRVELPDPELQVFRDATKWYLTMGDGDLEMGF